MADGPKDIEHRAFALALSLIGLSRQLSMEPAIRHLGHQLVRSGTSVGANLEEAIAAHSRADFLNKCSIALKEARETRYWLRLLAFAVPSLKSRIGPLAREAGEVVAILSSIIRKANQTKPDG